MASSRTVILLAFVCITLVQLSTGSEVQGNEAGHRIKRSTPILCWACNERCTSLGQKAICGSVKCTCVPNDSDNGKITKRSTPLFCWSCNEDCIAKGFTDSICQGSNCQCVNKPAKKTK